MAIDINRYSPAFRMGWRDYWVGYERSQCPYTTMQRKLEWWAGWDLASSVR